MRFRLVAALVSTALTAACSSGRAPDAKGGAGGEKKLTIGLSLDTLKEERWQRDRDSFVTRAGELGAKVLVQSANGDANVQNSQCENLLTQGIDLLVVVPTNAKTAATIVDSAHKAGVPVMAYDRLIADSDVDLYVTFDPFTVGVQQAEYLVKHVPKGNYVLIGGAPTDNNALLVRDGQMKVLKPYVDKGDIKIVADQWAKDWQPVEALKIMENALTRNNNAVDAVLVSNDGTAGGAIQALGEQKLTGKVVVTGQDADLAGCQRIVAGTQSMTVYKPVKKLATKAAELAIEMAQKHPITEATKPMNNGKKDVPSVLLPTIQVDKDNLVEAVLKDGWHPVQDVYRDVPKDQWPKL